MKNNQSERETDQDTLNHALELDSDVVVMVSEYLKQKYGEKIWRYMYKRAAAYIRLKYFKYKKEEPIPTPRHTGKDYFGLTDTEPYWI